MITVDSRSTTIYTRLQNGRWGPPFFPLAWAARTLHLGRRANFVEATRAHDQNAPASTRRRASGVLANVDVLAVTVSYTSRWRSGARFRSAANRTLPVTRWRLCHGSRGTRSRPHCPLLGGTGNLGQPRNIYGAGFLCYPRLKRNRATRSIKKTTGMNIRKKGSEGAMDAVGRTRILV